MNPSNDDRLTAFLAWRKRRALEAGLVRPEQVLDEWVFRRIVLHQPKDIYALEGLRLLTAPLFQQYGEDLLALCLGRPTEDERPRRAVQPEPERERQATTGFRRVVDRPRRPETVITRGHVRADDPPVAFASSRADKREISDFQPHPSHADWSGRPFEFRCSTLAFKFWETSFLEQWGALLEALSQGQVEALSEDELAMESLAARSRKPAKEWEQAWIKLILRRSYESI